ncbi:hypothetical protein ACT8ZV_09510 [Nocardioides sp. MAHUQ-72]|uniref:hypothetical protein n=1 Tax=unclassified Nocardioides TaxID=2615069 RepID=UPI0036067CE5
MKPLSHAAQATVGSPVTGAVISVPPPDEQGRTRPGYDLDRLVRLMRSAVAECDLDLSGRQVLTESATGAYVVTPVLAALAGASRVVGVTRGSRYGTVAEVRRQTMALATAAGVAERIEVTDRKRPGDLAAADVVTNSGHLRPIDAGDISLMKDSAVVPLMFEAWELHAGRVDIDLEELRRRGIATAGTNERHPNVDVFSYLGPMAMWQLLGAGLGVHRCRIVVLCDNPFADYVAGGLRGAGADVCVHAHLDELDDERCPDAILVALTPTGRPVVDASATSIIAERWPGTTVVQFWGDLDRDALRAAGVAVWPPRGPRPGHMGVLPSDIGPDAIVRLQAGGLKVAQVLLTTTDARTAAAMEYVDEF